MRDLILEIMNQTDRYLKVNIRENHNEFIKNNKLILKTLERYKSKKIIMKMLKVEMMIKAFNQSIQQKRMHL